MAFALPSHMVKVLVSLLICLTPYLASAQAEEPSTNEPRDVLFFDETATNSTRSESVELQLPYDGTAIEEAEITLPNQKEQLIAELKAELEAARDLKSHLYLPKAPADSATLENLKEMPLYDIQVFLRKKETFLRRFSSTLRAVKLPISWVNKAVKEVNDKFYRSHKLIARSNTVGGVAMLSVGAGLALPEKMVNYLKTKSIGRFIPDSGGFYYMLGLGGGVVRTVDRMTGESTLHLELFLDSEKLQKTLTGVVEATAAGTLGVVYEHRDRDFWTQKVDVTYGGAAGLFREGDRHFGWAASFGASIPPLIGAVLVYTDQGTRAYFLRLSISPKSIALFIPRLMLVGLMSKKFRSDLFGRSCSRVY